MPHLIHPDIRRPLLKSMGWFVVLNLGIGVTGIVDTAGHAGGLVSGLLIGYAYYPSLRKPWNRNLRYLTMVLTIIAAIGLSVFVYRRIPDDIVRYEQKMKVFASQDSLALDALNRFRDYPKGKQRDDLKAKGIRYVQQDLALLADIARLRLPAELQERTRKLVNYCQTQMTYYELAATAPDEDNPAYKEEIEVYRRKVDSLNKALGEDEK
jgi:rhomboid protease GluP